MRVCVCGWRVLDLPSASPPLGANGLMSVKAPRVTLAAAC